jgi:hypothetical protein
VASASPGDPGAAADADGFAPVEFVGAGEFAAGAGEFDAPDVACDVVELLELTPDDAPDFVVPFVVAALWVAPGSTAAMAPVASTPATPTPAVTADSRLMPRRRSAPAVSGRSARLTGIGFPFPSSSAPPWPLSPCLRGSRDFEDAGQSAASTLAFLSTAAEPASARVAKAN